MEQLVSKAKKVVTTMRALGNEFLNKVEDKAEKRSLLEFSNNYSERTVEISGKKVDYYILGSGDKTLLMLPGSTGKSITYYRYLEALGKEYKVITLSYPEADSLDHMLEIIEGLLDYETISEYYVFGQSFGGILAQILTKRNKQKVKGLILAHTNTSTNMIDKKILKKNASSVKGFLGTVNGWSYKFFQKGFAKRVAKGVNMADIENKAFWSEFYVSIFMNTTKEEMNSIYKCLLEFWKGEPFDEGDFDDWKGKALILEAETDHLYSLPEKERMKELFKKHETYDFSGSSNMAIIKNRELILEKIVLFVRNN